LGEIDIIAEEKDVLCFIEVKARHSEEFGTPLEAIGLTKQKQVAKSAFCYLKENRALDHAARFDVVALLYKEDKPAIDLIRDAFTLSPEFTA